MPNTYSWQFPRLDVLLTYETVADAVYEVHWRLTASDGNGRTAEAYGVQACGPIDTNNFIPYSSLTFLTVKGWIETQMGGDLYQIVDYLDKKIAEQAEPTRQGLAPPWV